MTDDKKKVYGYKDKFLHHSKAFTHINTLHITYNLKYLLFLLRIVSYYSYSIVYTLQCCYCLFLLPLLCIRL